jgi:NitT/TauT family transport system substrate-binding protein
LDIQIAALKGPSGFAAAKMLGDNFQPGYNVNVAYLLVASPLEAVTRMTSGEIDAAFLPVNTAAKLYTSGLGYKLAAVSGLGSLYMLSTDPGLTDWSGLRGKTIYLTGKGATPDYLIRYILQGNGLNPETDVKLNYTAAPPQIIQLIAAGKADTAFIPEPFAMLASAKTEAEIVLDPQAELMSLRGMEKAYPFTAFVISERLVNEHPEAAEAIVNAVRDSINWVLANPAEASDMIDNLGIMSAEIAEPAIPRCEIEFISAVDARADLEDFLRMLLELDPVSIGGKLPDEGFYFKN